MSRVCYSRPTYVRGGPCDLHSCQNLERPAGQLLSVCTTLLLALAQNCPLSFRNPSVSTQGYFHIFLIIYSNNSYCLCHQIQQAPSPVFWPAYSVPSLSHPLHNVQGCCHPIWCPSFLAQAFNEIETTRSLSFSSVFLFHLYNAKEEWGLCSNTG